MTYKTYDNDVAAKVIDVAIYNRFDPALLSSNEAYCLTVGQQVGDPKSTLAPSVSIDGAGKLYVQVVGPHTVLQPNDIAGCYPAEGSATSPSNFLPHIALTRRTLPWERAFFEGDTQHTPWLALLLFAESELVPALDRQVVWSDTVAHMQDRDPACYEALTSAGYQPSQQLDFICVTESTLSKLLPTTSELTLLCHVQHLLLGLGETATEASDPMWSQDPGCYLAIVIGNRLPVVSDMSSPGRFHACLISIEHRNLPGDLPWPGPEPQFHKPPQATTTTQPGHVDPPRVEPLDHLVVLHHWSFTPSAGKDFCDVAESIRHAPNGGVLKIGDQPGPITDGIVPTMFEPNTPPGSLLLNCKDGHVWYHGPLLPVPSVPDASFAVRATHHTKPGDDISYATAFEVGRLMALADQGILDDLQQLRSQWAGHITGPIFHVENLPKILHDKIWGPDPPDLRGPSSLVSYVKQASLTKPPDAAHDFTGVASLIPAVLESRAAAANAIEVLKTENAALAASENARQAALKGLGASLEVGGIIDTDTAASDAVDRRFSPARTAGR
jgi:hypothetical protein